jgi:replicative DNA helicase
MHEVSESIFLYNQDAEAAVLGALLVEPDLMKDCPLKPEQFTPGRNYNLFYTLRNMDSKGMPIDMVSIVERVGNSKVDKIGGVSYLSDLAGSVPTTANFKYYCEVVNEYYQKRLSVEIANALKEAANDGTPVLEAIQGAVNDLMAIEDSGTDDDDGDIKDALVDMYDRLESATGEITGIPTGFTELDKMTGGYQPDDFIIVGARPSVGKTAFAINIANNVVDHNINPNDDVAAIFSLEMSKQQLLQRASATIGHIDAQRMKSAGVSFAGEDWGKLTMAMGQLSNSNLKIFDRPGQDVNYIWSKCRKLKRRYEGKRILIIIDYLQLIVGAKKHGGNRTAEIGEISRMLKTMARELKITVIALSQLSRGVEQRQDKRPMMSDLRESGQIEQDADIIQFLYRDDYYDKQSENKNIIEIIMAKQRNGPVGNVSLAFVKEYGKFVNLARRYDE